MIPSLRIRPLWLLSAAVLGCSGGEPTSPGPASLRVAVTGLPSGTAAAITVSGPGGFSESVAASQTFSPVTPGTYTITAGDVTAGTSEYSPIPTSQSVAVNAGQVTATVAYSISTGSLAVTIDGLGASRPAAVTVSGPDGYSQSLTATGTLTELTPGTYSVVAQDVSGACGTTYIATPATQNATITARTTTDATVSYQPPTGGTVNLCIDALYLTQSTQSYAGTVPLVQNRNGYLRVFVVADRANNVTPAVQVRFYNGLVLQSTVTIPPTELGVPTAAHESSLSFTWDTTVSGALIQPGLRIEAEVDPTNVIQESNEGDNTIAVGPPEMEVRTVPALQITFVPIRQSGLLGNVSESNKNDFLDAARRMHPLEAIDAVVGPVYTTTRTLQAEGAGWPELLQDFYRDVTLDPQYCATGRYCYGVVRVSYTSGVAGIAYLSQGSTSARVALGWDAVTSDPLDDGNRSMVVAHELAHNWGRLHAPCGGPANLDPSYPVPDGTIGSYGVDVTTSTLKLSSLTDIMGYCPSKWIGEYSYRGVMDYRQAYPLVASAQITGPVQPSLLVWGRISDGALVLEPAFQLNARPHLPELPGPYSIKGLAGDGSTVFDLSFTPNQVADVPGNERHFAFTLPLSSAKASRLSSLRLTGGGRELIRYAQGGVHPDSARLTRTAKGRLRLRWDARAHPLVMIRDSETGQLVTFARGGETEIATLKDHVELVLSNGVKSTARRVQLVP